MVTKIIIGCDGLQMTDGFKEAIHNQYAKVADFIGTKAMDIKLSTKKAGHSKIKVKVICSSKHNATYIISQDDDDPYIAISKAFDTLAGILGKEHKMKASVTPGVTNFELWVFSLITMAAALIWIRYF